jgi:hypothetical protein
VNVEPPTRDNVVSLPLLPTSVTPDVYPVPPVPPPPITIVHVPAAIVTPLAYSNPPAPPPPAITPPPPPPPATISTSAVRVEVTIKVLLPVIKVCTEYDPSVVLVPPDALSRVAIVYHALL